MKILKNAGIYQILSEWPSVFSNLHAQQVLEMAGRTCYQSGKKISITDTSASSFIQNIIKRGHYSVIEHGWRGYIIKLNGLSAGDILQEFWPITKFLFVTFRPEKDTLLISANLETWRKLYVCDRLNLIISIKDDLEHFAPQIFDNNMLSSTTTDWDISAIPIVSSDQLETPMERLTHIAVTIQYDNHCRGFTHELVRHRIPVFSQESTRYVDESDFFVVVPPHKEEHAKVIDFRNTSATTTCKLSLAEWFQLNECAYRSLRKEGWAPEDARQILPIAIKAQIVASCNLKEMHYIFQKRVTKPAHWEIKQTEVNILSDFQKRYPFLFDDFNFGRNDVKDIPYYIYTGKV